MSAALSIDGRSFSGQETLSKPCTGQSSVSAVVRHPMCWQHANMTRQSKNFLSLKIKTTGGWDLRSLLVLTHQLLGRLTVSPQETTADLNLQQQSHDVHLAEVATQALPPLNGFLSGHVRLLFIDSVWRCFKQHQIIDSLEVPWFSFLFTSIISLFSTSFQLSIFAPPVQCAVAYFCCLFSSHVFPVSRQALALFHIIYTV